ncbi:MAG: hypothetical protein BIFFINMI_01211 [Phycisphaerae bacterium]|nr:hypothetical protein [Phycisphaerae bacterium]
MKRLKCPRCGEQIVITPEAVTVQCPSCFEEFNVHRPSPMGKASQQFLEQAEKQTPREFRPPSESRPARPRAEQTQAYDVTPAQPVIVQQPVVPAPVPSTLSAGRARLMARRAAARERRKLVAVFSLFLLILAIPIGIYAIHRYRTVNDSPATPPKPAAEEQQTPQRQPLPGEVAPHISPEPATRNRPAPAGNPAPPPADPTESTPPARSQPPVTPEPVNGLTVGLINPLQADPTNDTRGQCIGRVTSSRQRVLRLVIVRARFVDSAGQQVYNDADVQVVDVGPGQSVPFVVAVEGIKISRIADVKLSITDPPQEAPESRRIAQVLSARASSDDKGVTVAVEVQNPTDGTLSDLEFHVELFNERHWRTYFDLCTPREAVTLDPHEKRRVTFIIPADRLDNILINPAAEVRAAGQFSEN